jgi:hypothetical protein
LSISVSDGGGVLVSWSDSTTPNGVRGQLFQYNPVVPANHAPVARDDGTFSVNEHATLQIAASTLLANDSDADGDSLSVISVQGAGGGNVSFDGTTVTFTPTTHFPGPGYFTYTASDGHGSTDMATVWLNIWSSMPNKPPVAEDDGPFYTDPDKPLKIDASVLLANDTDADGGTLKLAGFWDTTNGTASLDGTTVTFTPTKGYSGPASFTYIIYDGQGGADIADVKVKVGTTTPNIAPVAGDDVFYYVGQDTPRKVSAATLLANDHDADGDSLSITSVQDATNGTVSLEGTTVTFTPNKGYSGWTHFTYTVSDGHGGTDTATAWMKIGPSAPANHAPVAQDDGVFLVAPQTPLKIAAATLLANDSDADGNSLSIASVQAATNGSVAFDGTTVTFTTMPGYAGSANFTYTLSDGHGGTDTAQVGIYIGTTAPQGFVNGSPAPPNAQGVVAAHTAGAHVYGGDDGGRLSSTAGNPTFQGGAGQDSFIIQAGALAQSSGLTNGIDADAVIFGFANAGGWAASNNDFVALTGFGAGSTMTFAHYGHVGGADDHTLQFYTVHDAASGADYALFIRSLDGQLLAAGDFNFL